MKLSAKRLALAAGVAALIFAGVLGFRAWRAMELRALTRDIQRWSALPDSDAQRDLQVALETRVAKFPDVAALVRALPERLLDTPPGMAALTRWAERDRPAVLAWLSTQHEPPEFRIAIPLRDWVLDEPDAADRYLASLPPGRWRERVLDMFAQDALTHMQPQRAISLLEQMPESPRRALFLRLAVSRWAHWDRASAEEWTRRLPSGDERAQAEAGLHAREVEE
jgi:hypothetical protein